MEQTSEPLLKQNWGKRKVLLLFPVQAAARLEMRMQLNHNHH